MVNAEHMTELKAQLSRIDVGVIDSRMMAYRVLSVLRVEPLKLSDVDDLGSSCRQLVSENLDQCLIENDIEDNTGEL